MTPWGTAVRNGDLRQAQRCKRDWTTGSLVPEMVGKAIDTSLINNPLEFAEISRKTAHGG